MDDSEAVYPHTIIAVGDRPLCVWDAELAKHNERFCTSLDPGWFADSVERHLKSHNGSEDLPHSEALSVRLAYHHALETFFAVVFAVLQAPRCLPAWLANYQVADLRLLIRRVQYQSPILNSWGTPRFGWREVSELIHAPAQWAGGETPSLFATAWSRLAGEFLDRGTRDEYNGLKHGFRATPSGGGIRMGLEPEFGVSPPADEMEWLGHSQYGSASFVTEPIPADLKPGRAVHLHMKSTQQLWSPESTRLKTHLLSHSIQNALSAARVRCGADPREVKFVRFEKREAYTAAWERPPGVRSFQFNYSPPPDEVAEMFPREEVLEVLKRLSGWDGMTDDDPTEGSG